MSLVDGLLNQRIDYVYSTSKDGYGAIIETEEYTNVRCRWVRTVNRIVTKNGEEISCTVEVWLDSDYSNIANDWIIKKDGEKYRVQERELLYDLDGELDHIKLYLV